MSWDEYPRSPLRVQIAGNMLVDGVAVRISLRSSPTDLMVGKVTEHGHIHFERVDELVDAGVTFTLQEEIARMLLDELLRYYQGASDMHTIRSDYLHERGRVDSLLKAITDMTLRIYPPAPQGHSWPSSSMPGN